MTTITIFVLNRDKMDTEGILKELLLREMSRRNTDAVIEIIKADTSLFAPLMEIFLRIEEPVSRRAAWVADLFSENQPEILLPYQERMIGSLQSFNHDGLKRHSLRMIHRLPLPSEESMGVLMQTCFTWLASGKESIAVKVYCMDILYKLTLLEPDLRRELADTITWRFDDESPGFRTHATNILRNLHSRG